MQPENVVHEIDDLDVISAAVRHDMGIAMLPSEMLDDTMQAIEMTDASMLKREMYAVYPSKRLLPVRVRELIDFMAS